MAKVKVHRFDYVLDWFGIKEVEVDLDKFAFFEMQFRCGSWYLLHFQVENCKAVHEYHNDFRLHNVPGAVKALGNKLKKFSSMHVGGIHFNQELMKILAG